MKTRSKDKVSNRQMLKKVIALARPYRTAFALAIILPIVIAPLSILRPYLIQKSVDNHILTPDISGLQQMMMILIALLMVESVMRYVFNYSTDWLGQSVIRDLRVRIFNHINKLKLKYFDTTPIGQSTTRTISDVETINSVFSQGVITIVADSLTLIAVLGIMLWTSWKLTLVCMIILPFLLLSSYLFKEAVRKGFENIRTLVATMNSFLQERLSGMRIVQIFNVEEREMKQFESINTKHTKANIKTVFAYAVFFAVIEVLSATALALIVWYGARGVIGEEITLGALIAFPLYINMLFRPIRMLADSFNTLQMGLVAAGRVFALLDKDEDTEKGGSLIVEKLRGEIAFENVYFAYTEEAVAAESWVLKNLSFHLNAGETLAIVGATGSGKTTIISLLNGFYQIQRGRILIDDKGLQEYDLSSLRQRIAVVLQDVFLFSGTVHENITLRDNSFTREQVIEAAKMIGAHEFIERLPGGYDYEVRERGATLSMGQRQLISFVRALVFDPDILILDEATSSVDPETESVIQFAIETLIQKRTSIIIAHRLSTIQHADSIMALHHGEIAERGSHYELLQIEDGHYRRLYEMQFAETANTE